MLHIAPIKMELTTAAGTFTGTAVSIAANIGSGDVMKTVVLGAIGAVSGYLATLALKALLKWVKSFWNVPGE